jgi:uncharacterized protein YdhG (YjbR/CyaY superfamily)
MVDVMTYDAKTVEEYIAAIPQERQAVFRRLMETIRSNLPEGFKETIQYKMPSFVVPLSRYPKGYHCEPDTPLPFISIASQKNHFSLYHSGLYADSGMLEWFTAEYARRVQSRLDMGKSCVRFRKAEAIPFELLGELVRKMSVEQWIELYERRNAV